jgi:hypothetical protein
VYQSIPTAKELWENLEAEYGIADAGIERFNASTFNKYVMVDGKSINEQIHEFLEYLREVEKSGSTFSEDYKVSCLIDKLPPSWNDFSKRHRQGSLTLTQALNSIRIEDQHRLILKSKTELEVKVNLVEQNKNSKSIGPRKNNFKDKNKFNKGTSNKYKSHKNAEGKGKSLGPCFVCGRTNHVARECFYRKTDKEKPKFKDNNGQAHVLVE